MIDWAPIIVGFSFNLSEIFAANNYPQIFHMILFELAVRRLATL